MTPQQTDFEARAIEVKDFVQRLRVRESATPQPALVERAVDRAAAVLFIYNLMEMGARSAGEAVFEAVSLAQIEFDELSEELRTDLFKLLKKKNCLEAAKNIGSIKTDIYSYAYDPKEVFAGNVDRRKWSERLKELGCQGALPADSNALLVRIKTARNDLAHGHDSFGAAGGMFSLDEIEDACNLVISSGRKAFNEIDLLISSGKIRK